MMRGEQDQLRWHEMSLASLARNGAFDSQPNESNQQSVWELQRQFKPQISVVNK
jgi:hypothetical protein